MLFINHSEIPAKGIVIIEAKGPLNTATSQDFEDYINQLIERDLSCIIFDAHGLEFLSSVGIGVILYIMKTLTARKGVFILCDLPEEVKSLLSLLGFNKILTIAESREDALMMMESKIQIGETGEIALDEIAISEEKETIPSRIKRGEAHSSSYAEGGTSKGGTSEGGTSEGITAEDAGTADKPSVSTMPDFANPLIVECAECKGLIRVKRSGSYQCPYCHTEFIAEKDRTIIF